MNDKKLLTIALVALVLIGAGVWIYFGQKGDGQSGSDPVSELQQAEATPQAVVGPDGNEVEPPPEDDDSEPDEAKIEQVKQLELELSKLAIEKPVKKEEVRTVADRTLALIDRLLTLHPTTSLRYAELLEERVTTTQTLAGLEGADPSAKIAMFQENLRLARDFAAKQPKLAVAHEVLGHILSLPESSDKSAAKTEFQECVKLEPTNGRCKRALSSLNE